MDQVRFYQDKARVVGVIVSPLITFLIAGMFSPGPNIIMLTGSGARFGARASWPHLTGVVLGVGIIGGVSGFGIGALIAARPGLELLLQSISALWILWMAYRMLSASPGAGSTSPARPMTCIEAILFQWVNPKIWAIALAASSGYSLGLPAINEAARLAIAFSSVNFFVCIFWTCSGTLLARLLNNERKWLIFRYIMAILLALSAALVFL